jgi:predicted outer membrane repeat protein
MGRKMAAVAAPGMVAAVLAGGMTPAAAAARTSVPCSTATLVRAISGAASGATLSLAKGCTYVLTGALPTVVRRLTIDGNGATLERSTMETLAHGPAVGSAAFTILTITAAPVTLNQLNFTNGNGAIALNKGAQLTVTGGVFSNNTAVNGAAIDDNATPVDPGNSTFQVTGASFINNKATEAGGAIYGATALEDQITNCIFQGNTAAGPGGAIFDWSVYIGISGSTFRGNKAATGGALFLSVMGPSITGTVIQGNSATGDGGGISDGNGGTSAEITGSKIIGNHAGGLGGGISEGDSEYLGSITNTTIANNSAATGGGINDGGDSIIKYTGDTITGNSASVNGGGIDASGSGLSFSTTTISGNKASGDGGGIYSGIGQLAEASFTNSTVSGNQAGVQGGGLYNQASLKASGTQITGNQAGGLPGGGGGGIYDNGSHATATLTSSSPTGNLPDNCEPLGSITGCTG